MATQNVPDSFCICPAPALELAISLPFLHIEEWDLAANTWLF